MATDLGKLLAGHLGLAAVISNVLIDKKIISREDLCACFRQAHQAAARSSGGAVTAQVLAAMVEYLEQSTRTRPRPQ